ncbi:MAG: GIY-YIG nuclease family protein [Saprospirales bacterium]|nr:GIY-YIG nuclease family protein [Saprospirales bacterium]
MRHYIYILQSQVDASFYTGYTSNISRRLQNTTPDFLLSPPEKYPGAWCILRISTINPTL